MNAQALVIVNVAVLRDLRLTSTVLESSNSVPRKQLFQLSEHQLVNCSSLWAWIPLDHGTSQSRHLSHR